MINIDYTKENVFTNSINGIEVKCKSKTMALALTNEMCLRLGLKQVCYSDITLKI